MSTIKVTNLKHESSSSDNISLDSSGNVGVGVTSNGSNAKFEVRSTTGSINSATLRVNGGLTTTGAANTGSTLLFAGNIGTGERDFASVFAGKENGTSGNNDSYLAFGTRANGGSVSEKARITSTGDFKFNSGYGSAATAYGVRAWCNVNFTGSGSIRASGNVSSVTDRGTGRLQINLTTAMPDANYAAFGMQKPNADIVTMTGIHPNAAWSTYSTNQVSFVYANSAGGLVDPLIANMVIVR